MKNRVETAWILAEIEPCCFESMQNSSDSEKDDVYESQDGHRREIKYIVVCMRVLYDRELRRATRERMFMLQGDRGSRK